MYNLRVWNMKVLITIVLLLAAWAGCPLEVMAQQANTTVSGTLEIYSVVGIRVKEIPMKQPSGEYAVDIAKGYYIVRIGDTVRKVSIR